MPSPFGYEWGSLADPGGSIPVYDPSTGQSFEDYMAGIEGSSIYDFYSYSSEQDELSGLGTEELAEYIAEYGYDYFTSEGYYLPVGAEEAYADVGGMAGMVDLFVDQFTSLDCDPETDPSCYQYSPFAAWESTDLDFESAIATAQQDAMMDTFTTDWEGQYALLNANLDALSQMHDLSNVNMSTEYSRAMRNLSDDQAAYIKNQASGAKGLSGKMGRSGLSGGTLSKQEALLHQNISNSLRGINVQKQQAMQAYNTGLESASDLYDMNIADLEDSFYAEQAEATLDLNSTLTNMANQFEMMAGSMYDDWYADLIAGVGTFAVTDPTVAVGDWEFDWSPFGLDFDPSAAATYTGPSANAVCGPTGDQECIPPESGCSSLGSEYYFSQYCNACVSSYDSTCP